MVQSQFSVSWDAYKSSICGGFGSLQQNGEFVDMTLAADGHFVKVHQVLMALVSPYLKELITSAPCQHPVIFLNNVSHRTLSSLLEYIYTGEVLIPSDGLSSFVEIAKSLHIKGLEDLTSSENMSVKMAENPSMMEASELCHVSGTKRVPLLLESGVGQVDLPAAARKIIVKTEKSPKSSKKSRSLLKVQKKEMEEEYSDPMDDTGAQDDDDDYRTPAGDTSPTPGQGAIDTKDGSSNVQYSVSIRGALQVILNRYIYNVQSTQHRNNVRRWRCIDYRNNRCMAFLVTKGNVVLNRANLHNHSFHDKKILQKIEKKAVFSALDDVQGYKEKECEKDDDGNDTSMESDYMSVFSEAMAEDTKKRWSVKPL